MEVTRESFDQTLPRLLRDISDCVCVAFDLEFSGIFDRRQRKAPVNNASGDGKQTLQGRYEEVKEAAENYQVLQIGLTFVIKDPGTGSYTLRPYNFHLNPVIDPKLDLERQWSYQSSAIDMLLESGFRMEAPFTEGIPYISRSEEDRAKARLQDRQTRLASLDVIATKALDTESTEFVEETRRQSDDWLDRNNKPKYLNIPSTDAKRLPGMPPTINNFQKRLVHQLVRSDYPTLVSIGKECFVQILPYDKQREENVQAGRMRHLRERIFRQMGFRWVVEAMVGGDLSKLPSDSFSEPRRGARRRNVAKPAALQASLKEKRPVLAGHNLFTDMVNFYECFFGDLPDKVEDFQQAIHELFPMVVDTKYMATYDCGSNIMSSSLPEIDDKLAARKTPVLNIDPEHTKYAKAKPAHEAGYDSLITARVFMRLAAELYEKGEYTGAKDEAGRNNDLQEKGDVHSQTINTAMEEVHVSTTDREAGVSGRSDELKLRKGKARTRQAGKAMNGRTEATRGSSTVVHKTKFELLADRLDKDMDFESDSALDDSLSEPNRDLFIPDREFWNTYGNRLRMFGTTEGACKLGS